MGRTRHEISRLGEAGDHPARRTIPPVRRTLAQIRIPRSTFYRWCDQYQTGGPEALDDRSPRPDRVWNRIPDDVRARVVTLALDQPESGAGRALYRCRTLLRVGSFGLSP